MRCALGEMVQAPFWFIGALAVCPALVAGRARCRDSLRVRIARGSAVLDDLPGALSANPMCDPGSDDPVHAGSEGNATNGALTAKWGTAGLSFSHQAGGKPAHLLSSDGPLTSAFSIQCQQGGRLAGMGLCPTRAAFKSSKDEVVVGLGQHSSVPGGQRRLNQKGYTWPLGITKYQIMVPYYVSSSGYGFFFNAPGDGAVDVGDTSIEWTTVAQ
eukprot:gene8827-1583_t